MAKPVGVRISGVGKLRKIFDDRRRKGNEGSVAVGYTADYALPVHEMTEATFQRPGAKAKFLEDPVREMHNSGEVQRIVQKGMKRGMTLMDALMVAGLRLQRESQKVVPIDEGNLHNSAYTRRER